MYETYTVVYEYERTDNSYPPDRVPVCDCPACAGRGAKPAPGERPAAGEGEG